MECLNVNQILELFRGGLLTGEWLKKAYNIITYKILCEGETIDSIEIYHDFVEAVRRRVGGIPPQVNMEDVFVYHEDVLEPSAAESMMISQQDQRGSGSSTQEAAGPSAQQQGAGP